jgi:tRNA(adenine34) deaminase
MHSVVAALDLEALMREALLEAEAAGAAGDYPIGAVLVIGGAVHARGRARHPATRLSQLAHAELEALLHGGEPLWEQHEEGVLISTVEPCTMCLGAVVMADVPHVVFAAHDPLPQTGLMIERVPYVRRHIETYLGGILEEESQVLIERYPPRR